MTRIVGLPLVAFALLGAPAARADTSFTCPTPESPREREKAARTLFDDGVQVEASDPEGALARYRCASTLAVRPVIELRIGVVAERLHRDDVAIVAFERYLELAGASAPDADSMRQHVRDLKAKRDREIAERQKRGQPKEPPKEDTVPPPPPPPHDEPTSPTVYAGWGLAGLGVVLGAVGTGLLVSAKSKSDAVHDLPAGTPWSSDKASGAFESAKDQQASGTVLVVIAPIALAAGVVLLLTNHSTPSSSRARGRPLAVTF